MVHGPKTTVCQVLQENKDPYLEIKDHHIRVFGSERYYDRRSAIDRSKQLGNKERHMAGGRYSGRHKDHSNDLAIKENLAPERGCSNDHKCMPGSERCKDRSNHLNNHTEKYIPEGEHRDHSDIAAIKNVCLMPGSDRCNPRSKYLLVVDNCIPGGFRRVPVLKPPDYSSLFSRRLKSRDKNDNISVATTVPEDTFEGSDQGFSTPEVLRKKRSLRSPLNSGRH